MANEKKRSIKITENGTKGKSLKVICLNCKVETNHLVFASIEEDGSEEFGEEYFHWKSIYQIIRCNGCDNLSFRIETRHSEMYQDEEPEEIVYPERSKETISCKIFSVLPDNIDKLYQEVIVCYNNNILTLCAVGIRAIVEAICLEKNIAKSNLKEKIDDLVEREILTKEKVTILHNHRLLGNEAVHKMSTPKKEILKIAIDIIESMLDYIYEIPYKGMRLERTRNNKGLPITPKQKQNYTTPTSSV